MNQEKLKLQRLLASLKHGYRNRIDPCARERLASTTLRVSFKKRAWLKSSSPEFVAANYAMCVLLQDVITLLQLEIWNSLQNPWPLLPEPPHRVLSDTRKQLKGADACMYDLMAAIELVSQGVRSMTSRFSAAKFHPDKEWDLDESDEQKDEGERDDEEEDERQREKDREYAGYKCAAVLPVLSQLVEEVLPPLQKKIKASEPPTKDFESD